MQKILLTIILLLIPLFALLLPLNVSAQGTHTCTWTGSQLGCGPANTVNCAPGYDPDYTYCNNFDGPPPDPGGCNNAAPTSCLARSGCVVIGGTCMPASACSSGGGEDKGQLGCQPTSGGQPTTCCIPLTSPTSGRGSVGTERCTPAGGAADSGINTAIGCIPALSNINDFIGFILRWAIGIGGGIGFILILIAGFQIMTSQGDPQRLQAGKELLTSAIVGLILIIFSVFILEIIGVDLLGIPGFR